MKETIIFPFVHIFPFFCKGLGHLELGFPCVLSLLSLVCLRGRRRLLSPGSPQRALLPSTLSTRFSSGRCGSWAHLLLKQQDLSASQHPAATSRLPSSPHLCRSGDASLRTCGRSGGRAQPCSCRGPRPRSPVVSRPLGETLQICLTLYFLARWLSCLGPWGPRSLCPTLAPFCAMRSATPASPGRRGLDFLD